MFARKHFLLMILASLTLLSLAPSLYLPLVRKDGPAATFTPEPTATNTQQPGPCNCAGPDLDCGDFSTHNQAQSCFDYCFPQYGDIFNLDGDGNGLACESLP